MSPDPHSNQFGCDVNLTCITFKQEVLSLLQYFHGCCINSKQIYHTAQDHPDMAPSLLKLSAEQALWRIGFVMRTSGYTRIQSGKHNPTWRIREENWKVQHV